MFRIWFWSAYSLADYTAMSLIFGCWHKDQKYKSGIKCYTSLYFHFYFTFTFFSLWWCEQEAVELFSASSGAMHQPSFSNSSSDNDARTLQINTDPHIETNHHSERSSTTAFQNQPLKKVPIWHRRKVVFKELWSQVKCSTWPSRYLWWIEEADSQDQFKWQQRWIARNLVCNVKVRRWYLNSRCPGNIIKLKTK